MTDPDRTLPGRSPFGRLLDEDPATRAADAERTMDVSGDAAGKRRETEAAQANRRHAEQAKDSGVTGPIAGIRANRPVD